MEIHRQDSMNLDFIYIKDFKNYGLRKYFKI